MYKIEATYIIGKFLYYAFIARSAQAVPDFPV